MTHASLPNRNRHDTLSVVTGRSGRGTARQTIRVDESLWERFEAARQQAGATDRSTVIREFIRWYVHERDEKGRVARLPKRPTAAPDG